MTTDFECNQQTDNPDKAEHNLTCLHTPPGKTEQMAGGKRYRGAKYMSTENWLMERHTADNKAAKA